MNDTCWNTVTSATLAYSSIGCVTILICSTALVKLLRTKLYTKLIYRLASYSVLSALADGIVGSVQLVLVFDRKTVIGGFCVAVGFLHQYVVMVKLMFSIWVTFHIFSYAIFYKDLKRLEVMYVVTSLLLPLVLAIVPLATRTYGLAGSWCWIKSQVGDCSGQNDTLVNGVVEQFVLLYIPGIIALLAESVAVVTIVAVVCYRKKRNTLLDKGAMQSRVLRAMLPLVAYPIAYCVLFLPAFAYRAHTQLMATPHVNFLIIAAISIQLWSLAAGLSLWFHIGVVRCTQLELRSAKVYPPNFRTLLVEVN